MCGFNGITQCLWLMFGCCHWRCGVAWLWSRWQNGSHVVPVLRRVQGQLWQQPGLFSPLKYISGFGWTSVPLCLKVSDSWRWQEHARAFTACFQALRICKRVPYFSTSALPLTSSLWLLSLPAQPSWCTPSPATLFLFLNVHYYFTFSHHSFIINPSTYPSVIVCFHP